MLQPITPPPMMTISLRSGTVMVVPPSATVGSARGLLGEMRHIGHGRLVAVISARPGQPSFRRLRQLEAERRSEAGLRVDPDPAVMGCDQRGDDRQTQAGAASRPGPGPVGAVEPLEDVLDLAGAEPGALIGHLKPDRWLLTRAQCGGSDSDLDRRAVRGVRH